MSRMSGTASTSYRERNSTADRALDILLMFTDTHLVVSGTAVAERLGVARSTAYRYLQSLVSSRFLEEAPGGGFRLGLRVMEIARLARRSYGLSEVALPAMTALAEDVRETVLLTRRTGELVVCVDRAEAGTGAVRISYERGSTLPSTRVRRHSSCWPGSPTRKPASFLNQQTCAVSLPLPSRTSTLSCRGWPISGAAATRSRVANSTPT